jgi:hypothetical protein
MALRGGGRQRINFRISNTGKDSMAAKCSTVVNIFSIFFLLSDRNIPTTVTNVPAINEIR